MDAFEQLVAELFSAEGFWVETSVKVELSKEEKRIIGRASAPRWEIDIVAYRPGTNELLAVECKSFIDSTGVTWDELQDGHKSTRYKMFREPVLREVVLRRLKQQLVDAGRCPPSVDVGLAMVAGKVKAGAQEAIAAHFEARGWHFHGPDWLYVRLEALARRGYSNQVSAIVAKLLLRPGSRPSA